MRVLLQIIGLGLIVLAGFLPMSVSAEELKSESSDVIENVIVKGNQRIEEVTILAYTSLSAGDSFNTEKVNASLKRIFSTGLFANVSITRQHNDLVIDVIENPIINEVVFEGNKRIDRDTLLDEISLRTRSVYTKAKVQNDVKRIIEVYQKSGRFSTSVEPKVIQLDQNRINLVYEIKEGPKTHIRKVVFVGNKHYKSRVLKEVIQTKEARWYRFFSGSDTYDADRLAYDKELLRKFYISRGYADFNVVSAVAELTPGKEAFYLTFTLDEGEKYTFGNVKIDNALKNLDIEALQPEILTKEGETFNASQVESTIDNITSYLANFGYAFVSVKPSFDRNAFDHVMGVTYEIAETQRVYVDNIHIKGNQRTLDRVVRREFRIVEGDPYNAAQIRRSQQRIRNLGFFDKVDIQTVREVTPDKVDIEVNLTERSTGELNFGAGFSTTEGALASVSVRERNLLGKGQDLRLSLQKATKGAELDLSFTEPYFMDKEVAVGFDIFNTSRDFSTESSYDRDATGFTLRATYTITEHLKHMVKYTLRADDIHNVSDDASLFIKNQRGENTISLLGHSLILDKRDNKFDPKEGYLVRFSQDISGLGGDSRFLRQELRTNYYKPVYTMFNDDVVLGLTGRLGYVFGLGDKDVRINERFYLGGNDLRGFRRAGLGPRDNLTRDALGGNLFYVASSEATFPLGLPDELGFRGSLFMDIGSLSQVDESGIDVLDKSSPRLSVGAGIAWSSPLGPIRIYYGHPIMKEDFDKEQEINFTFGTRF